MVSFLGILGLRLKDIVGSIIDGAPISGNCSWNPQIKSWASLGDSYANVVGGGGIDYEAKLTMNACLQSKKHQDLANSGATISQITSQQVPRLDGNTNFVTLSTGTNDFGLVQILDACVYGFQGSSSPNCSTTLSKASAFLASSTFASSVNSLLSSINSKLSPNVGKTFVVGGAAFFDETTPSCNQTSLSVYTGLGQQKFLTTGLRANLNEMIQRFNWWQNYLITIFNRATVPGNSTLKYPVQFIDSDDRFNARRFCNSRVMSTGSGDPLTYFVNGGGLQTPVTRSSYEKVAVSVCNANGSWNDYVQCQMATAIKGAISLTLTNIGAKTGINDWERVFHLTAKGQGVIADEIVARLGQPLLLSGFNLRILPLGASIIAGSWSSDGNGFRKVLYDTLRSSNKIEYVGSQGIAPLNHEGHPGWIIGDISNAAGVSLPSRPNVVLIHAGTNDLLDNFNIDQAPERLGALIDHVLSIAVDAVVLVAQILPCSLPGAFDNFVTFNARVANIINQRQVAQKKVLKVWMPITTDDLVDGIHPNDTGYNKMAEAWIAGLHRAADFGWISDPVKI